MNRPSMNQLVKFAVKILLGGFLIGTGGQLVRNSVDNAKNIGRV